MGFTPQYRRLGMNTEAGFCGCGCGRRTALAWQNHAGKGWVRGEPLRFVKGHNLRGRRRWRNRSGYILIHEPEHPSANASGAVYEHVLIAEAALGKRLPDGAQVHHVNGDRADNRPRNLVVCENQDLHGLLHQRGEAHRACGRAQWRKCKFCRRWDDPAGMYVNRRTAYHRACAAEYERTRTGARPRGPGGTYTGYNRE